MTLYPGFPWLPDRHLYDRFLFASDVKIRVLMVTVERDERPGGISVHVYYISPHSTEPLLPIYRPIYLLGFPFKVLFYFHCICIYQMLQNGISRSDVQPSIQVHFLTK